MLADLSPHQIGKLLGIAWSTAGFALAAITGARSIVTYRRAFAARGGGPIAVSSVLKAKEWQRQTLATLGILFAVSGYGSETFARLATAPNIWDGVVTAFFLAAAVVWTRHLWRLRWQIRLDARQIDGGSGV